MFAYAISRWQDASNLQTDCFGLTTHTTWWKDAWEWSPHVHAPQHVNAKLVEQ